MRPSNGENVLFGDVPWNELSFVERQVRAAVLDELHATGAPMPATRVYLAVQGLAPPQEVTWSTVSLA